MPQCRRKNKPKKNKKPQGSFLTVTWQERLTHTVWQTMLSKTMDCPPTLSPQPDLFSRSSVNRFCCSAPATTSSGLRREQQLKRSQRREDSRLFIHIYTFWFCRTCCCVSIWLTCLTIRWSTVYLLSGPLQKRTWQLFSFPQEAGNCSVMCCVGELRAEIDSQCKNTIWVHGHIDN